MSELDEPDEISRELDAIFAEFFDEALRHVGRRRTSLAVLFIDLDRFKVINDSLGHETGDALLVEMARRLRQNLRASDIVARLERDKFTIIQRDQPQPESAAD